MKVQKDEWQIPIISTFAHSDKMEGDDLEHETNNKKNKHKYCRALNLSIHMRLYMNHETMRHILSSQTHFNLNVKQTYGRIQRINIFILTPKMFGKIINPLHFSFICLVFPIDSN